MNKKYPSKITLNLAQSERSSVKLTAALPLALALIIIVAAFTKFAVLNQLARVNEAEAQAAQMEATLAEISGQMADYDQVRAQYLRVTGAMSAGQEAQADRLEIMDLVEDVIMSAAQVTEYSVAANTLTVTLEEFDFAHMPDLLDSLSESPLVDSVNVYNAGTGEDSGVSVSMTIILKGGQENA